MPRTEPPRRTPVPVDPALPRLRVLLAPDTMAPFLHRSLGPEAPFPDVRIHHIRYMPGTRVVVRYDVGLDGRRYDAVVMVAAGGYLARRAEKPKNVALARLVDGRSPASMPLRYEPELDALIQWYPLDLELPALAEPPTRLLDELEAAGVHLGEVGGEPAVLAYKPRRRVVLRAGEHVLKLFASQAEFVASSTGLRAAGALRGVRTPGLEGELPKRLVTVQPLLAGAPPERPAAVASEVGELLRRMQAAWWSVDGTARPDLSAVSPSQQLAVAAGSARYLAAILPLLSGRLERLLRDLEAATPAIERPVFTHGDLCGRQLLLAPNGLAVLDFDAMRLAAPAFDPATYAAHLICGGPDDLDDALEVLEELLVAYGGRPLALSWYLATCILRHARSPFRYYDERWPERIEGMVKASEDVLHR